MCFVQIDSLLVHLNLSGEFALLELFVVQVPQ